MGRPIEAEIGRLAEGFSKRVCVFLKSAMTLAAALTSQILQDRFSANMLFCRPKLQRCISLRRLLRLASNLQESFERRKWRRLAVAIGALLTCRGCEISRRHQPRKFAHFTASVVTSSDFICAKRTHTVLLLDPKSSGVLLVHGKQLCSSFVTCKVFSFIICI